MGKPTLKLASISEAIDVAERTLVFRDHILELASELEAVSSQLHAMEKGVALCSYHQCPYAKESAAGWHEYWLEQPYPFYYPGTVHLILKEGELATKLQVCPIAVLQLPDDAKIVSLSAIRPSIPYTIAEWKDWSKHYDTPEYHRLLGLLGGKAGLEVGFALEALKTIRQGYRKL